MPSRFALSSLAARKPVVKQQLQRVTSGLAHLARAGTGSRVGELGRRPEQHLVLYQMENCPYSRKVREAMSVLDLDVEVRPCPKGGQRFRGELRELTGREQIPLLVDPNTSVQLNDSDQIVKYLFETYGSGGVPLSLRLGPVTNFSSKLASALRGGVGPKLIRSTEPTFSLELWGFETDAETRTVRAELDAYEIPYTLYNVAVGSPKRRKLAHIAGRETVPYLVDANRGVHLAGAQAIVEHVERWYAKGQPRVTSYRSWVENAPNLTNGRLGTV